MKNLKIGEKIFLGFAIVIALMIVITGAAVLSGFTAAKNLDSIGAESILQTQGVELANAFYIARLDAKIICYVIDGEAYAEAKKNLDLCEDIIGQMQGHIAKNPILEKFRTELDKVRGQLAAYSENVVILQDSNIVLAGLGDDLGELGAALTALSDALDGNHIGVLYDSVALDLTPDERTVQMDNLTDGAMISQGIWNMRINTNAMIGARTNYTKHEADLLLIDDTIALVNGSKSDSNQIDGLKEHLPRYRELVKDFHSEVARNNALAGYVASYGDALLGSLNSMMNSIDSDLAEQVEVTASTTSAYLVAAIVISVISIITAVLISLYIGKSITRPVKAMVSAADTIAVGDTDVDIAYVSKDEIGKLSASFKRMIDTISEQVSAVAGIADGDLSVEVKLRGKKDRMGAAMVRMVENLNGMFSEINTSTEEVSSGSKQIADGAQALAQGSTQQAAAVQQLSSSIAEVAQKTRENAEMAGELADFAGMMKRNAEKGNLLMNQMIDAVKDINLASKNISKVIKVIDDIAFQTNILALNAAVEAAQAGQHGKGFNVVAEEVRNLAAKSAEAAKETENLISDSIKKAVLGLGIAEETSAGLAEIVTGINATGKLADDIARSSGEQSMAISQINIGIDQVAQVVHQNSATAEESAAASRAMSEQSDMLARLIAQFKLKDGAGRSLSPSTKQFPNPSDKRKEADYALFSENTGGFGKY